MPGQADGAKRWGGEGKPLVVQRYDPQWSRWFERIRAALADRLGELARGIEHVGSTAVPGMTAKPVIDVDVVIDRANWARVRDRLEAAGFRHRGDLGVVGRESFRAREGTAPCSWPAHQLYVCPVGGPELGRHLAFRDYLRRHPEEAARLSERKWALRRTCADVAAYQEAKAPLVGAILARALEEAAGPGRYKEGPSMGT